MRNKKPGANRQRTPPSTDWRGPLSVLYEDNHLLVVDKPAMLPTMGVSAERASLLTVAKDYVRHKYNKPGNVFLGIVSRLDAPVTGVVLVARTSKAADRLTRQYRENQVTKIYWAIVPNAMDPQEGICIDWLRKHERHRRVEVSEPEHALAKQARLSYRTLRRLGERSLLEIRLETGRKHQIRVQLAERGHPILGDRKYGSQMAFAHGIALHARQLELEHPVRKTPLRFVAPLPVSWDRFRIPT